MSIPIAAIYDHGLLQPLEPSVLPEGANARLHLEEAGNKKGIAPLVGAVVSPRLLHPEQAEDFTMEIREVPNAGV